MKRLLLFFLLLSFGCNKLNNKNLISSDEGKYWDVLKHRHRNYIKPSYCYYFDPNGECLYYSYKIENGKIIRNLFDYGDVIYPNTWQLKSDTLKIQGFKYLIKTINKDRIVLVSIGISTDTIILGASKY